jgi:hypothetical protein
MSPCKRFYASESDDSTNLAYDFTSSFELRRALSHSVYRSRFVKALCVRLPAILAHRVVAHLNAVGVVDQPIEDAIGQNGIANLFVPARDWQLRSQDRRTHLVSVSIQVRARSPTAIRKTIWKTGRRKPLRDYEKTIGIEPTTEP